MDDSSVLHHRAVNEAVDGTTASVVGMFNRDAGAEPDARRIARLIIEQLFEKRRLHDSEEQVAADLEAEARPHMDRLIGAIQRREPIDMILPGFPAKSPNRNKTLGPLPDLADKHGLENLNILCNKIAGVYPPGARITICSDGHVFSDLIRIPDEDVTAYGQYLRQYAKRVYGDTFDFFDLNDAFEKITSHDILREELLVCYGESVDRLRRRCREEKEAKAMYRGMTRFIFEDYSGIEPFKRESRTAVQQIARLIAYRVIQRSNAWTRLLEEHFADAIRLSIHPQFRVSRKIGVFLADTGGDCWLTPWHSAALKYKGKIRLCKRAEAERDALLAFDEGRPSHFEKFDNIEEAVDL